MTLSDDLVWQGIKALAFASLGWHVFLVCYHVFCFFRHPLSRASGDGSGKARTYSLWRSIALASWLPPSQPAIYSVLPIDVTDAERAMSKLRLRLAAEARRNGETDPVKVTWTHLAAMCICKAIADHPRANARAHLGRVIPCDGGVDLFMQVALKGDSLSGIVVRGAEKLGIEGLAAEARRRVSDLRGGRDEQFNSTLANLRFVPSFLLRPILMATSFLGNDLGVSIRALGVPKDPFGTVQVTSLGMFPSVDTALPPFFPLGRCSTLLLVGAVKDKPMVVDGKVVPRRVINICTTLDHRVIDGVLAAKIGVSFEQHLHAWTREVLQEN